ncbi:hypothetical protein NYR97_10130 [Xanthomonas hydrangeae]|uniref:DUF2235 domain-containing protein n=1 Tax=Xanthomonas hydrangeae TaxID=2775159 RepID=A0AAU0BFF5_9XANT|nr:hypothetical protein [Xanthomonas hydrangeae]WOB51667.1 hypothetical protein NYR97_10130 [Xanthomonas hydrangeae]
MQRNLASYNNATQALSAQEVPILVDSAQPHSRLFIAAFDGTGNNLYKDAPEHRTNVAESYLQIDAARRKEGLENIGAGYVEGVGTQGGLGGTRDLMQGYTYEARLEEMYVKFAEQSAKWIREDPEAKISLASHAARRHRPAADHRQGTTSFGGCGVPPFGHIAAADVANVTPKP